MVKQGITSALSLSALLFAAAASAGDPPAKPAKPKSIVIAAGSKSADAKAPEAKAAPAKPAEAKDALGDAFIAQNALRIYLGRPALVTLHNSRGQLLFQKESSRPMEVLPLSGVTTGFLYLTLRAGQLELTKKLVYSGK